MTQKQVIYLCNNSLNLELDSKVLRVIKEIQYFAKSDHNHYFNNTTTESYTRQHYRLEPY